MKYTKLTLLTTAFFLVILSFHCKHDPDIVPGNGNGNGGGNNPGDTTEIHTCDPDTVYFRNDVLPLLLSNCTTSGCHDQETAQKGVVLIDYASVISTGDIKPGDPDGSEIFEKITETDPDKRMPPPPNTALTPDQINIIKTWIEQGALNNSCDSGCDTTNVTFSGTVWPTLENNCVGCHSGNTPSGGILLTNYNEVVAIAVNGKLQGAINHQPNFSPMPKNGNKLSDCSIREIEIWIENGTPNN